MANGMRHLHTSGDLFGGGRNFADNQNLKDLFIYFLLKEE